MCPQNNDSSTWNVKVILDHVEKRQKLVSPHQFPVFVIVMATACLNTWSLKMTHLLTPCPPWFHLTAHQHQSRQKTARWNFIAHKKHMTFDLSPTSETIVWDKRGFHPNELKKNNTTFSRQGNFFYFLHLQQKPLGTNVNARETLEAGSPTE